VSVCVCVYYDEDAIVHIGVFNLAMCLLRCVIHILLLILRGIRNSYYNLMILFFKLLLLKMMQNTISSHASHASHDDYLLLESIALRIAQLHRVLLKRKHGLKYYVLPYQIFRTSSKLDDYDDMSLAQAASEICKLFSDVNTYISPIALESLKHLVSREDKDFLDMTSLMRDLPSYFRLQLATIFKNSLLPDYTDNTIVVSDIDNTAVENSSVAPVVYTDKKIIPGFETLVYALTFSGTTTVTFISARPQQLEFSSILGLSSALKKTSLPFSFSGGNLRGPCLYASAMVAAKSEEVVRTSEEKTKSMLLDACTEFAKIKLKRVQEIMTVYPNARIVFFGDDSQGDYLFAHLLVNSGHCKKKHYAFIRSTHTLHEKKGRHVIHPNTGGLWPSTVQFTPTNETAERILHHTSYYEALVKCPLDILSGTRRARAYENSKNDFFTLNRSKFVSPAEAAHRDNPWISKMLSCA
jgi:hypothetical protein